MCVYIYIYIDEFQQSHNCVKGEKQNWWDKPTYVFYLQNYDSYSCLSPNVWMPTDAMHHDKTTVLNVFTIFSCMLITQHRKSWRVLWIRSRCPFITRKFGTISDTISHGQLELCGLWFEQLSHLTRQQTMSTII